MKVSWKSKSTRYGGAFFFIAIILILIWKLSFSTNTLPSFTVQQGDFLIPITTKGEMRAVNSISITVPRARGYSIRITRLIPEGAVVKKGDFLVQFDTSEITETIHKRENELKNAIAELNKLKANIESTRKDLESQLEMQKYSYEQAELQLKKMEFESEARRREEELSMKKAEIALNQAKYRLLAQKAIDKASLQKAQLTIDQAQSNLDAAKKNLKEMTILSPANGMVVYNRIWGPSGLQKVKVGDTPWYGQAILEIPDLSKMYVKTKVNEVDIDRLRKGQLVSVTVDAVPGLELSGKVSSIAALAHNDPATNNKVFDVNVSLDSTAQQLKPGMTATCKIITDRLKNVMSVPLESVFEKDGKTIVYVLTPKPKAREVDIGEKNEDFVIIKKGLKPGEKVSLWDPTKPFREMGKELPSEQTKPKSKKRGGSVQRMIIVG